MLFVFASHACIAQSAAPTSPQASPEVAWNRDLLTSGRVEQEAARLKEAYRGAEQSVTSSVVDQIKQKLPSLDHLGSSWKYGGIATVSSQGPEVIALIRQIPMRQGPDRIALLKKLVQYASQGTPEAQTFSGFVYENGLFGVSKNLILAREFYLAAATRRYQPALFNLASLAYFGKGQPADVESARRHVAQAMQVGPESSARVCGLASYIEYRQRNVPAALAYGRACSSPLANIPNAVFDRQMPVAKRVRLLRDSIATGAQEGYRLIEEITKDLHPDNESYYCKYHIINQMRAAPGKFDVITLARTCFAATEPNVGQQEAASRIRGIANFAVMEQRVLDQMRLSNRFRHGASVPYLPFSQVDVDLYQPVMKEAR